MRWAAVVLAAAAQPASFYFQLDNTLADYLAYEHKVEYDGGQQQKECGVGQIPAPFHDDRAVRENQCFMKCNGNAGAPGCGDYVLFCAQEPDVPECNSGSNMLCLAHMQMRALCNAVTNCTSYTFKQMEAGRQGKPDYRTFSGGELNTADCEVRALSGGFADGSLYTQKEAPERVDCPLGIGVEVTGGIASMQGLYEADLSDDPPERYDHAVASHYIQWKASGVPEMECGWVAYRNNITEAPPVQSATCGDSDHLANWLYDQCAPGSNGEKETCEDHEDYEANWCSRLKTVWGTDYCGNAVWARVCATSCGTDCSDEDVSAAQQYMFGAGLVNAADAAKQTCETVTAAMCGDPIVPLLCPFTPPCTSRRLAGAEALAGREGLRRELRERGSEPREVRRLEWMRTPDGDLFEEVWYASVGGETCAVPAAASFGTAVLYDVRKQLAPVAGVSLDHECTASTGFWSSMATWTRRRTGTLPVGRTGQYCKHNNIQVAFHEKKELVDNTCYLKCGTNVEDSMAADGDLAANDWCSGNSEFFERDTLALCLPRERCEELCAGLDDCHSFDMHRYYPRCYLNSMDCKVESSDEAQLVNFAADEWDLVQKEITPDETVDPKDDAARVVFATKTGLNCTAAGTLYAPTDDELDGDSGTCYLPDWPADGTGCSRAQCEAQCLLKGDRCAGFFFTEKCPTHVNSTQAHADAGLDVHPDGNVFDADVCSATSGKCELYTDVDLTQCVPASQGEPRARSIYTFVAKEVPPPCSVSVTGEYVGDYVRPSGKYDTYVRTDSKYRLKYADGQSGGYECYGWMLQQNNQPPTVVEMRNCTDKSEAAADYLAHFATPPASGDWTFACHWGAEKGYCADPVFGALCPHKCYGTSSWEIVGGTYYAQYGWTVIDGSTNTPLDYEKLFVAGAVREDFLELMYNMTILEEGRDKTYDAWLDGITNDDGSFKAAKVGGADLTETIPSSSCMGDHNFAMFVYRRANWSEAVGGIPTYGQEYDAVRGVSLHDVVKHALPETMAEACEKSTPFCTSSTIVQALCPAACKVPLTPFPTPGPPIPDEADPQGAMYLPQYHHGITTMDLPPMPADAYDRRLLTVELGFASATVTHYDGNAPDDSWVTKYTSWKKGASSDESPASGAFYNFEGDLFAGTPCERKGAAETPLTDGFEGVRNYDLLETGEMYVDELPLDDSTQVKPVCRGASVCPQLTSCVLTSQRFQDEMSVIKSGVARGAFLSELQGPIRDVVLGRLEPKVLMSIDRAEAIINERKVGYTGVISRGGVIDATRVEVLGDKSVLGKTVLVSLVPAGLTAERELGRNYGTNFGSDAKPKYKLNAYWQPWRSDIIRIERFDQFGVPLTEGMFTFTVYAPAMKSENLVVFRYSPVVGVAPVDILNEGGSVKKLAKDGMWEVTVMQVNADFVVTEDLDECAEVADACDQGSEADFTVPAVCTNMIGAAHTCTCAPGYTTIETGDKVQCYIPPEAYSPGQDQNYYLRIAHTTRLDYGWRVSEVKLYSDILCSKPVTYQTVALRASDVKNAAGDPVSDTHPYVLVDTQGNTIEQYLRTGPDLEKSSYTTATGSKYLFDGKANAWWSYCLNCNPETSDQTRNGASEIVLAIKGDATVGCIQVEQMEGHATTGIVVERGPVSGTGCGMAGGPLCAPSMVWRSEAVSLTGDDAKIPLGCGEPNMQYFGELLIGPSLAVAGHFGAYGAAMEVPSACHCHELCIQYAGVGCRSYKYEVGNVGDTNGHCFLQSNKAGEKAGGWGTEYVTSGVPSQRFAAYVGGARKLTHTPLLMGFKVEATEGARNTNFEVGCRPRTFAEKIAAIRKDMGCANADPSGCPCDPDGVGLASYSCPSADDTLWESDGQMCVKLYPDMDQDWNKWPEGYDYPADYGLGCKVHIEPGSYHCTKVDGITTAFNTPAGTGYNSDMDSEAWCTRKWCYVDPCKCDARDMQTSSWVSSAFSSRYYSYSACGAVDTFTTQVCTASTRAECVSSGDCIWGELAEDVNPEQITVTVQGVGMPFSSDVSQDLSEFQRVKVLKSSQGCAEELPGEVEGLGCTRSVRKGAGGYEETVHTLCSPRPAAATAETAVFGPVSIRAADLAVEYKVCYCPGRCADPKSWLPVPGTVTVPAAAFTFSSDPPVVYRKAPGAPGPASIAITVNRPAFRTFSNAAAWTLKIVKANFDCDVAHSTHFSCGAVRDVGVKSDSADAYADTFAAAYANGTDAVKAAKEGLDAVVGPVLLWEESFVDASGTPYVNLTRWGADYGLAGTVPKDIVYELTFDEVLTTDECTGAFNITVGGVKEFVNCFDAVVSGKSVLLVFGTLGEGTATLGWDAGVVADYSGNQAPGGEIEFEIAGAAGDPVVVAEVGTAEGVDIYFSTAVTVDASKAAAVTATDCGYDGVCNNDDDFTEEITTAAKGTSAMSVAFANPLSGRTYGVTLTSLSVPAAVADYEFSFTHGCATPQLVPNVDSATWFFDVQMPQADAGPYLVCFREELTEIWYGGYVAIPSAAGGKLQVQPLPADSALTRGVFYTQRFSALAGAAHVTDFNVSGRLLIPGASAQILLSTSPTCAPTSKGFALTHSVAKNATGGVSHKPVEDGAAPTLLNSAGSFPENTATFKVLSVVIVSFSEPVTVEGCSGSFKLNKVSDDSTVTTVPCSDATVMHNRVRIPVPLTGTGALTAADDYYVALDFGAVLDLQGNMATRHTSASDYTFTVDPAGAAALVLAYSEPRSGGTLRVDTDVPANLTVTLGFSYKVTAKDKLLVVSDCGTDLVCDADDVVVARLDPAEQDLDGTGGVVVGLGDDVSAIALGKAGAPVLRRYQLLVPAGAFELDDGTTGTLNAETTVTFVVDATGFHQENALSCDAGASDGDNLVFHAQFGDVEAGAYSVCFCDDQSDSSLEDLYDGATTFTIQDHVKLATANALALNTLVKGPFAGQASIKDHQCGAKCASGCTGPTCFCEGYSLETRYDHTLCLSGSLCREACELLGAACGAANVHATLPLCRLSSKVDAAADELGEEWSALVKQTGTACTHAHDFSTVAGVFTLTKRVDVAVDYVVEPGVPTSLELTSQTGGLTTAASGELLTDDRIMVIDANGACGLTAASDAVKVGLDGEGTWPKFGPQSLYFDAPAMDGEDPHAPTPQGAAVEYTLLAAQFCGGENLDLAAYEVPKDGTMVSLADFSCYSKCLNCEGPSCATECLGYLDGFDGPDSNAICGDKYLCESLCNDATGGPECVAVDMHAKIPRCYLNTGCSVRQTSKEYGIRLKPEARRLAYQTVDEHDLGFSHGQLLRFFPVTFSSGGTFKLCFCDSELLADGKTCMQKQDFSVEVGTVHASGISCLLQEASLQRADCAEQALGGTRCYQHYPLPSIDVYSHYDGVYGPPPADPVAEELETYCLMLPQEVRASNAVCEHAGLP